mgnify:FL=1
MSKALQIAKEVLDAVGGKANVTGNDICMTRLRIKTEDPSLVDTDQLTATRGVLGIVQRGKGGIEVVFGPGKVEDVHEALADLTGIESSETGFSDDGPSRMDVIVSSHAEAADGDTAVGDDEDDDLSSVESLVSLLDADDETSEKKPEPSCGDAVEDVEPVSVLVLNGPNINMLGIREPGIYGSESYTDLLQLCQDTAAEVGFDRCTCYQSNHEGDLVDAIQDAMGKYDGIVINPGAYTHTSIAILDAAKAVRLPIVEVHISKVEEREEFRQVSYIRQACFETITGMGINGYRKAILDLAEKLDL